MVAICQPQRRLTEGHRGDLAHVCDNAWLCRRRCKSRLMYMVCPRVVAQLALQPVHAIDANLLVDARREHHALQCAVPRAARESHSAHRVALLKLIQQHRAWRALSWVSLPDLDKLVVPATCQVDALIAALIGWLVVSACLSRSREA